MQRSNHGPLKYTTVAITCDTAKQDVSFGIQRTLEGKTVHKIIAQSVTYLTTSPSGAAVINATAFKNAYLVLRQNNADVVENLPLSTLQPQTNNGVEKDFHLENIDWANSKIHVGTTTGLVAAEQFVFTIGYTDQCNG
ncbi:MAG: hypothetical protein ACXWW0_00135 [Bacteroidia bacterium]